MLFRSYILCAALLLLSGRGFSDSIVIQSSLTQVGTTWKTYIYDYTVDKNRTVPVDGFGFDIYLRVRAL